MSYFLLAANNEVKRQLLFCNSRACKREQLKYKQVIAYHFQQGVRGVRPSYSLLSGISYNFTLQYFTSLNNCIQNLGN